MYIHHERYDTKVGSPTHVILIPSRSTVPADICKGKLFFATESSFVEVDNNERALSTHCEFFSLTHSQINSPLLLQWMCKYLMESSVCPCLMLHCYFCLCLSSLAFSHPSRTEVRLFAHSNKTTMCGLSFWVLVVHKK